MDVFVWGEDTLGLVVINDYALGADHNRFTVLLDEER
jgi:hypothetical protein